jgi:DNA polymerase (family 10)
MSSDLFLTAQENFHIAKRLQELTTLLAFQGEKKEKLNTYEKAIRTIKSSLVPISALIQEGKLTQLPYIGPAIAQKITDIYLNRPDSKYRQLLDHYGYELLHILQNSNISLHLLQKLYSYQPFHSLSELKALLFALPPGKMKGIGEKSLQKAQEQLLLYEKNRTKWLYHDAYVFFKSQLEPYFAQLLNHRFSPVGKMLTASPVLDSIELLFAPPFTEEELHAFSTRFHFSILSQAFTHAILQTKEFKHIHLHFTSPTEFESKLIQLSFHPSYWQGHSFHSLHELLTFHQLPLDLSPEFYDIYPIPKEKLAHLPTRNDIKGILHIHTPYSDGYHSLDALQQFAIEQGYHYLGITDHSVSAFYANGLSPEQIQEQWRRLDLLNEKSLSVQFLKGIECDVLADGTLDYDATLRSQFDFIIASIHSNLSMSQQEATQRWLSALHSATFHVIGHISGRLLLSRPGYPLNYDEIFSICRQKGVAIEFNVQPSRMDLDWELLPHAVEYGIPILLAPDAHSLLDFAYIETGLRFLRKALIPKNQVLNTWELEQLKAFFHRNR